MSTKIRSLSISILVLGSLSACSSGGGGGGGGSEGVTATSFNLESISVPPNAVWQINREIEFEFSRAVDFSSVSSNTINIQSEGGIPATGSFAYKQVPSPVGGSMQPDLTTIVFQPTCPTEADFSDAGLVPGGTLYVVRVNGEDAGTNNTVRSQDSRVLNETRELRFTTPQSTVAIGTIFLDDMPGPPIPVVRETGSVAEDGVSFISLGNNPDPNTRIYYEYDPATQSYSISPGSAAPDEAPLNLYADRTTSTAVIVEFNQAVNNSPTNISDSRVRLEYEDSNGDWLPVDTRVQLLANCTSTGATLRLDPIGLLPRESRFRVVVLEGFQDIVGTPVDSNLDQFGVAPTEVLSYQSLNDPGAGSDEFFETFLIGGDGINSFEDTEALFDTPLAAWEENRLEAAFDFSGTGGPRGDFDWVIDPGEIFVFDTTVTSIVGGPNGVPTTTQNAQGGVVDVRNLIIREGGTLRVQGSVNTMLLNATGYVLVEGVLDASGFGAKDVATLNTGNQPEKGGTGAAGGGKGGDASLTINNSTKVGGTGSGPFFETGTGGLGGETAYAKESKGKNARRPGGGGGGRFAADAAIPPTPLARSVGLWAQKGYDGDTEGRGACTNQKPARGGQPGKGPFQDGTVDNDFFGTKPVVVSDGMGGYDLESLIRGELTSIWAGYGGGGGGDAVPSASFPFPNWKFGSDEKGGGGGGGGGGVRIRALGPITFARTGLIESEGGKGGAGENTNFLDHVGGTGGAGSGGHIILESATRIDFTNGDPTAQRAVNIRTRGGPTTTGPNVPRDNIPVNISYGGAGSPGVIQLHVPSINPPSDDPATSNIIVSTNQAMEPDPLDAYTQPIANQLIPTFGARSKARSRWISVGGATLDPVGGANLVEFLFDGVDTTPGQDQGKILGQLNRTKELDPILGPATFPSPEVDVLPDEVTLRLTGASLDPLIQSADLVSKDIYLRTPTLFEHFLLRVSQIGNPTNRFDFDVAQATYDDDNQILELTVGGLGETIGSFLDSLGGLAEYSVVPRFFRTRRDGIADSLPNNSFVKITFDAAKDDGFGNPDEANLLVDQTGDISDFNALAPGELQFFRFQVEFNLDAPGDGVQATTKPVSLDFLRIPFRF